MPAVIETDVLIIGAGPCGLFQAFELGLLGVSCRIVEGLPHPGGQCAELYPDKPIYDIPGTVHTRADQLIVQLLEQLRPFDTPFHYNTSVSTITGRAEEGFTITTSGDTFEAKCVVLAVGVGAFSPVRLKTDGIEQFDNRQVFYDNLNHVDSSDANIVVCGDGEQAVSQALALALADTAHVTLLHRTRRLAIDDDLSDRLQRAIAANTISALKGKIADFTTSGNTLSSLQIQLSRTESTSIDADLILVKQGTSPKLVSFEHWGLADTGSRIDVDPGTFESAIPGLYVVGDVNQYPAKRKLILCGFHEATLAAFAIAARMRPEKPIHLQYTTTSTELRARLGVA
jgi:thioredoxin reductase (NADPH)